MSRVETVRLLGYDVEFMVAPSALGEAWLYNPFLLASLARSGSWTPSVLAGRLRKS
jgi:hypothetical protein